MNAQPLQVAPLGPGDCYAVQSHSDPDRAYLVVRFVGTYEDDFATQGQWRCSCPAGVRGVLCRHIEAVKAHLAGAFKPDPTKPVRRHLTPIQGGAA